MQSSTLDESLVVTSSVDKVSAKRKRSLPRQSRLAANTQMANVVSDVDCFLGHVIRSGVVWEGYLFMTDPCCTLGNVFSFAFTSVVYCDVCCLVFILPSDALNWIQAGDSWTSDVITCHCLSTVLALSDPNSSDHMNTKLHAAASKLQCDTSFQ